MREDTMLDDIEVWISPEYYTVDENNIVPLGRDP